jgi:hypothetical protein
VNYKKSEIFILQSIKSITRDHFPERLSQRRRLGYTSKVTDHTSEGTSHRSGWADYSLKVSKSGEESGMRDRILDGLIVFTGLVWALGLIMWLDGSVRMPHPSAVAWRVAVPILGAQALIGWFLLAMFRAGKPGLQQPNADHGRA